MCFYFFLLPVLGPVAAPGFADAAFFSFFVMGSPVGAALSILKSVRAKTKKEQESAKERLLLSDSAGLASIRVITTRNTADYQILR